MTRILHDKNKFSDVELLVSTVYISVTLFGSAASSAELIAQLLLNEVRTMKFV